jgi:predicted nucleotidyltransferase
MPQLVELGLVERSEIPPASQFVLVRENIAARFVLRLAGAREAALEEIGDAAGAIEPSPVSVIVFGSVARGEADEQSDVDVVVIRPDDVSEDDERWSDSVDDWRRRAASITGNKVEILEAAASEAGRKLRGRSELWQGIKRDGIAVHGTTLAELAGGNEI